MPIGAPTAEAVAPAGEAQAASLVPFIRAAHRHFEPAFDLTTTTGASSVELGPFDVPAYGFIRSIVLLVTSANGVLGAGSLVADAPFSVLSSVQLLDTNGFPIYGPLTGYQTYLANTFGAYKGYNDPTVHPDFSASINPSFVLRIPVEITGWDGFGSLSNQSQSAPFRVRITLAPTVDLATGAVTTPPDVRIRGYLEAWSQPAGADLLGQGQETAPPGHGTTQYWTVATPVLAAARQQIRFPRVGNLIRNAIMVFRDTGGLRDATVEPDDFTLNWDARQVLVALPNQIHRSLVRDQNNFNTPAGVLPLQFNTDQDGVAGQENRHLWLPTVGSTRLEIDATFGAAGTMEIITNDVAVTALGR